MARKIDPQTGKPDDRNGRDAGGGPADDIPANQFRKRKGKKLTRAQARDAARRKVEKKIAAKKNDKKKSFPRYA